MIQKSDVKVYLKAVFRGQAMDYCKKWTDACDKIGLDYVFVLRGWGDKKPGGKPVEIFDWDVPSVLNSDMEKMISNSPINIGWRGAAMAHCLPYFHNERKYTIGIDADDCIHESDMGNLLLSALNAMEKNNTPVLAYDLHLSLSDDRIFNITTWPHIWCMGVCLSENEYMKNAVNTVLSKIPPNHVWKHWLNIDLALDKYFQYELDCPICFVTKTGRYIHGWPGKEAYFGYDEKRDFVIKDYRRLTGINPPFVYREVTRHPRTLVLEM